MNTVALSGNICRTPELKHTPNNIPVCTFTIGVRRPMTKDTTDFINCVAWRKTAEFICTYFSKGDKIEVSGYITSHTYEDKSGNKRVSVEVLAREVGFGSSKSDGSSDAPMELEGIEELADDDDLPFYGGVRL